MNTLSSQQSQPSLSTGTAKTYWVDEQGTFHENYSGIILLGDRCLGEFVFDPGNWPALGYRRTGAAYFCSHCGDVWARIVLADSRGVQMPLDVERVACEKHPDSYNIPGSLLAGRLAALVELLPYDALRREFVIYINRR